jgi:hypothetical protein
MHEFIYAVRYLSTVSIRHRFIGVKREQDDADFTSKE